MVDGSGHGQSRLLGCLAPRCVTSALTTTLAWCRSAPLCRCSAAAASAVVALLLGLNVARTYQDKLRQFLADVAGEQSGSFMAAAPSQKAE